MKTEVIVTMAHVQKAGFCAPGLRTWSKQKGFDLRGFLKNGMPASRVAELNDGLANRVLAVAMAEAEGERNGR